MDATGQDKGTLAWTEEAKFQFLLRIVAQLKGDGRGTSIKWEKINIPGRTVKSLQNMWTKINKQISDFEARENSGEVAVVPVQPRKRGRPSKKGLNKEAGLVDEGVDDEGLDVKPMAVKKRGAEDDDEKRGAGKKRSKVKAEAMADDAVRFKNEQV
ncbi:hypothetical protein TgHK011_004353 [Trichoderma gracile]|nr:hypothetical protein TgHK011_004353 [Trichoderma gracile]